MLEPHTPPQDEAPDFGALQERMRELAEVHKVLREMMAWKQNIGALGKAITDIQSECADVQRSGDRTNFGRVEALALRVEVVEESLLKVDDILTARTFRSTLRPSRLNDATLAHYARFCARHHEGCVDRWDRAQFLATRMITLLEEDGTAVLRPRHEAEQLLRSILPPTRLAPEERGKALLFFESAIQRLAQLPQFESLFATGLFADVRGYRMALGTQLFDVEVILASAELHNAMSLRVAQLMAQENIAQERVIARMEAAYDEVDKVFKRDQEVQGKSQSKQGKRKKTLRPLGTKDERRRAVVFRVVSLAGAGGAMTAAALSLYVLMHDPLTELDPAVRATISPALVEGREAADHKPPLFVGRLDNLRWKGMSKLERGTEAERIRRNLEQRGIKDGLVFSNESMVAISIRGGSIAQIP
jgi:hypothetical protein